MKIIASIPSYKEALFLDYCIRAIYDFADEIVLTNTAMAASIEAGYDFSSGDGTEEIIESWIGKPKIHVLSSKNKPNTFRELMQPALDLAKRLDGNWLFTVGADEIWPKSSLMPLRNYLGLCDKQGILGLNAWMHIFAPDFWHCKDFRNPRLAKITSNSVLVHGDAMRWPELGVYQFAGNTEEPFPPGTPIQIVVRNSDYPRQLKAFHYSCVGKERVEFKSTFYKSFDGSNCDKYVEAYLKEDWGAFAKLGYKEFTGKHPDVMIGHPLFSDRKIKS